MADKQPHNKDGSIRERINSLNTREAHLGSG